jgi:hypothetical protein
MDNPEKLETLGRQHTRRRQTKRKKNKYKCKFAIFRKGKYMFVFISQRQILHLSLKYYSITQYLQVSLYTCWQKVLQLGWLIVLSVVIAMICLLYNSKSNDRLCMIQENRKTQSYQSNWKWNSFTIETQRYINKRTHNLTAQKKPTNNGWLEECPEWSPISVALTS